MIKIPTLTPIYSYQCFRGRRIPLDKLKPKRGRNGRIEAEKNMGKLTLFIDESGKPEVYSNKGINLVKKGVASKFLVLACVRSTDQLGLSKKVNQFKLDLLNDKALKKIFSSAYTLDAFHANKDYPIVKRKFYKFITILDVKLDVVVVEKLKCYNTLQENPGRMYGVMTGQLIKNLAHQGDEVEIIFSRKDSKLKLRKQLQSQVDIVRLNYLSEHPKITTDFSLTYQHNPHYSHAGLQIADYIAYAVFKVFESNNDEWFKLVSDKIGKIQDICNKKYFTKSNPLELSI